MVSVKLYVEGGGDRKNIKSECRRGFQRFLEKAGLEGKMPRIIVGGGRQSAFAQFRAGLAQNDRDTFLLVDSECPVATQAIAVKPWQYLKERDGWEPLANATDDQCHLMVQVMEAWFLTDRDILKSFYGHNFQESALPSNLRIEQISKQDIYKGLESATRNTTKGSYSKGKHSFDLLAQIDPDKVTNASPYAKRFIDALMR